MMTSVNARTAPKRSGLCTYMFPTSIPPLEPPWGKKRKRETKVETQREREREKKREKEKRKERDRDGERQRVKERERDRDRERETEREKERDRVKEREIERDRERERETEREKEREGEGEREKTDIDMMYSELTSTLSVRSTFHLLSWPLLYSTLLYSLAHPCTHGHTHISCMGICNYTYTESATGSLSLSLSQTSDLFPHTLSLLFSFPYASFSFFLTFSQIVCHIFLSLSLFVSLYLSLLPLTPRWAGEVTPLLIRSSATAIKSS